MSMNGNSSLIFFTICLFECRMNFFSFNFLLTSIVDCAHNVHFNFFILILSSQTIVSWLQHEMNCLFSIHYMHLHIVYKIYPKLKWKQSFIQRENILFSHQWKINREQETNKKKTEQKQEQKQIWGLWLFECAV